MSDWACDCFGNLPTRGEAAMEYGGNDAALTIEAVKLAGAGVAPTRWVPGVHASMGSKILKGERALTVEHLRKLADRFKVRPELFMQ